MIAAPISIKIRDGERDPELHQAQRGSQFHFGMKARIGVDAESSLVHTVIGAVANVNVVIQGHALLQGKEEVVFAYAGDQVAGKRREATRVQWHLAMRPSKRKAHKTTARSPTRKRPNKSRPPCGPKSGILRVTTLQFGQVSAPANSQRAAKGLAWTAGVFDERMS